MNEIRKPRMDKTEIKNAGIKFYLGWIDHQLSTIDGSESDGAPEGGCESQFYEDFATLEEAVARMKEKAKKDKIAVVTGGRYGIGTITRNVYEVVASMPDEYGELIVCSYDGKPYEEEESPERLDVLDLHPEMRSAWQKALDSHYAWLDYRDDDVIFAGLDDALCRELGDKWPETEWIVAL